jgi:hypothetical protein
MEHIMLAILAIIAAALAAHLFLLRPVLRARAELSGFYDQADGLWRRVGRRLKGWRTILWARCLVLAGVLLPLLDAVRVIDIAAFLPSGSVAYAPLVLAVIGLVTEALRRVTTTPAGAPAAPSSGAALDTEA